MIWTNYAWDLLCVHWAWIEHWYGEFENSFEHCLNIWICNRDAVWYREVSKFFSCRIKKSILYNYKSFMWNTQKFFLCEEKKRKKDGCYKLKCIFSIFCCLSWLLIVFIYGWDIVCTLINIYNKCEIWLDGNNFFYSSIHYIALSCFIQMLLNRFCKRIWLSKL